MDVLHTNFALIVFLFTFLFLSKISILLHTLTFKCRSTSVRDPMGNDSAMAFCDFENLVYQAEDEGEEDCEVPGELARLL